MKKLYFSMVVLLFSNLLSAQCLNENFDNLSLSSYTTGTFELNGLTWSGVNVISEFKNNSFGGSGKALRMNDDKANSGITTPSLITPRFISFDYRELNSGGGTFVVQKSIDGGTTFTDLCTQQYSGQTYENFTCDINESSTDVLIRILSDDNPGHLIIDNLSIECGGESAPTCSATLELASANCGADNTTYTAVLNYLNGSETEAVSITATAGDVNMTSMSTDGTVTISNIPAGTDIDVTASSSTCNVVQSVTSPVCGCTIESVNVSNIVCNNFGSIPDATDDYIVFDLTVVPTANTATTYSLTASNGYTLNPSVGTYDEIVSVTVEEFGAAGSGDFDIIITDADDNTCSQTVTVTDPGSCSFNTVATSNNILITEVVDANESGSQKYVEICNRGDEVVDISGWGINRYSNGGTSPSLAAIGANQILQPGDCHILKNNLSTQFENLSCESTSSTAISGNGDDVYELVDASGTSLDVFGVIGEDGTGTEWEYQDAIGTRNPSVSTSTTTWNASEWEILRGTSADATPCEDPKEPLMVFNGIMDNCNFTTKAVVMNGNEFQHLKIDNQVIAAINPNGNDLGKVHGSVFVSSVDRKDNKDNFYLNRSIFISPANQPTTPATIKYYFNTEELEKLIAASPEVASVDDLSITEVSNVDCSPNFGGASLGKFISKENVTFGVDEIGDYLQFDVDGFSSFTAHGGSAVLPVELAGFNAEAINDNIELAWSTNSETNNDFFTLSRSNDGVDFEEIAVIDGNGTSTVKNNYNYTDTNPFTGINYYQLTQVDFDGTATVSNVISVSNNGVQTVTVRENALVINDAGLLNIEIYNLQGQSVKSITKDFQAKETINLDDLDTAMYVVRVNDQTFKVFVK